MPRVSNNLSSCETPKKGWKIPENLIPNLADPTFQSPGTVDLLIGGGVFFDVISTTVPQIPLNVKNIVLSSSNFRWIVTDEIEQVSLIGIHSVGESLKEDWKATMANGRPGSDNYLRQIRDVWKRQKQWNISIKLHTDMKRGL